MDADKVLARLVSMEPTRLEALPRERGIYALRDHAGDIRYIGITKGDNRGFYGRIFCRHVSGSETRSHKFSHAYNTGRMWRERRDSHPDAFAAKHLRTAFIRQHCRASYLTLPPIQLLSLARLEIDVQSIAPAEMLAWGNKRGFNPLEEPRELVDALIEDLAYTTDQRAAIERQSKRCRNQ